MPFDPNNFFPLLDLPADVLRSVVGRFLSPSDKFRLGRGTHNKRLYSIFKSDINQYVQTFLLHVAHGEQAQAEAMIKQDPGLLFERRIVKDYAGHLIEGTALQIALGAEDVRYHEHEICMVEMIKHYLSEAEIAKQTQEQFPEGWELKEDERVQRDSAELKKVVTAIDQATPNDDCEVALQAFRDYLESQIKGIIKTGKHFNSQLLIEALKLFEKNYNRFGGYDSHRNNLLWRKVIGYIQRFVPAALAQAIWQGVWNIVDGGQKLSRSSVKAFFPPYADPNFRMGYEYGHCGWAGGVSVGGGAGSRVVGQLMSSKNFKLAELMQPHPRPKTPGCVIC